MTIKLNISGAACATVNGEHVLNNRHVIEKPNGWGKTTLLNAIRLATTGECNIPGIGNVPGSLFHVSAGGPLTIDFEADGVGTRIVLESLGQKKINVAPGFACRVAHLAMGGSAEEIRAFLASALPAPAISQSVRDMLPGVQLPPASDVLSSLSMALEDAKRVTARERAAVAECEKSRAAYSGLVADANVNVSGSLEEWQQKRDVKAGQIAILDRALSENAQAISRWNAAVSAAKAAKEALDAAKNAVFPVVPDVAALEKAYREAEDKAKANGAFVIDRERNLAAARNHDNELAVEYKSSAFDVNEAKAKIERLEVRPTCDLCGAKIESANVAALRKDLEVKIQKRDKAQELLSAQERTVESLEYAMAESIGERTVAEKSAHAARIVFERAQMECDRIELAIKATAEEIVKREELFHAAAATLDNFVQPKPNVALLEERAAIVAELKQIEPNVQTLRRRQESARMAADLETKKIEAQRKLADAMTAEVNIKSARNSILGDMLRPMREALNAAAKSIDADAAEISLGEGNEKPFIGIRRGEHLINFTSLSGGERAIFLSAVSMFLLERANVADGKKILLVEAAELDAEHARRLFSLFRTSTIGHVIMAVPKA